LSLLLAFFSAYLINMVSSKVDVHKYQKEILLVTTKKKRNALSVELSGVPTCAWTVRVMPNAPVVIADDLLILVVLKNLGPGVVGVGPLLGRAKEEIRPGEIRVIRLWDDDAAVGVLGKDEEAIVAMQFFPLPK
jgi:hypothetical protein